LWIYYLKNRTPGTKLLAVFYLLAATLQVAASMVVILKTKTNIWMYETVAFLTAAFISHHFYRLLQAPKKKKAVIVLFSIYLVYVVIRQITIEGTRLFDSFGYSILSASIAVYVFMYFHQLLQKVSEVSILKDLNFWLASGYLFYYVGSFIIFVSYYYFTSLVIKTLTKAESALLTSLWGLHNVLLFISALSLLIGSVWINSRRKLASS
jgi:hypothetical protein